MSIAATIKYFGEQSTTVVMQTTDGFDGSTAQATSPTLSPGQYLFAAQSKGGLYNFHEETIIVTNITYQGSGTCVVNRTINGSATQIAALTGTANELAVNIPLTAADTLTFVSTGAGKIAVSGKLASARGTL